MSLEFRKRSFEKVQKNRATNCLSKYSQIRRGCLEPMLNPSQFSFRESESARNVTLCRLATYETTMLLIVVTHDDLIARQRVNCRGSPGKLANINCESNENTEKVVNVVRMSQLTCIFATVSQFVCNNITCPTWSGLKQLCRMYQFCVVPIKTCR